jgi:hypothetical protein
VATTTRPPATARPPLPPTARFQRSAPVARPAGEQPPGAALQADRVDHAAGDRRHHPEAATGPAPQQGPGRAGAGLEVGAGAGEDPPAGHGRGAEHAGDLPADRPGAGVQRQERTVATVGGVRVRAAVDGPAGRGDVAGVLGAVANPQQVAVPQLPSGGGVEGAHPAVVAGRAAGEGADEDHAQVQSRRRAAAAGALLPQRRRPEGRGVVGLQGRAAPLGVAHLDVGAAAGHGHAAGLGGVPAGAKDRGLLGPTTRRPALAGPMVVSFGLYPVVAAV